MVIIFATMLPLNYIMPISHGTLCEQLDIVSLDLSSRDHNWTLTRVSYLSHIFPPMSSCSGKLLRSRGLPGQGRTGLHFMLLVLPLYLNSYQDCYASSISAAFRP